MNPRFMKPPIHVNIYRSEVTRLSRGALKGRRQCTDRGDGGMNQLLRKCCFQLPPRRLHRKYSRRVLPPEVDR